MNKQTLFSAVAGLIFLLCTSVVLADQPTTLIVPPKLQSLLKSFEASAVLYVLEENSYLVSSDDTTESDSPWLFWVTNNEIFEKPARIEGLEKITDIESISRDGEYYYFLCSMSLNKNGKRIPHRNLLVRALKIGRNFQAINKVDLREKILEAAEGVEIFKSELEKNLDIESHFSKDGHFYVGVKNPLTQSGKTLILRLGMTSLLFDSKPLDLQVWKEIQWTDSNESHLVSDIYIDGDQLWLTTVQEPTGSGSLWNINLTTDKLNLEKSFPGRHPEGVTYDSVLKKMVLIFDEGAKGSQILRF